jgi:hypothetical protein
MNINNTVRYIERERERERETETEREGKSKKKINFPENLKR